LPVRSKRCRVESRNFPCLGSHRQISRENVPLNSQITLVSYEYHRYGIPSSVVEDLVADDGAHFERSSGSDRVNEDPSVKSDRVSRRQDRELILV
jgi:hypothetical protein